jgi:hypothetical protein
MDFRKFSGDVRLWGAAPKRRMNGHADSWRRFGYVCCCELVWEEKAKAPPGNVLNA